MQARTPESLGSPEGATGNGKTAQSYIAGIGASGALLAGAVVTFVFLVGTVSFEVWPAASNSAGGTDSLGVAELSGGGDGSATASLGTTVALIADSIPTPDVIASTAAAPKAGGGLGGGGGIDDGSGDSDDGSTGGNGGSPGGSGDGGTVGEDPGGDPGNGNDGENEESDRPTGHRPSGGGNGNAPGDTAGTGSPPTPPGSNEESDRPSGGGGRG
jgi:hypothetical protein